MEVIDDALSLLQTPEAVGDPAAFAEKLRQEEQQQYEAFMATSNFKAGGEWVLHDVGLETLYKAPNYCHTARLPAETRAKGILTGRSDLAAQGTYDTGIEFQAAISQTSAKEIPLVYEQGTRQPCQYQVQNDFKDFFFVSSKNTDYASMTLPTDSEIEAYGGPHTLKGVIAVCGAACGWRCPPASLDVVEGSYSGGLKFRVNGLEVKNVTKIGLCAFLQLPDGRGHIFPPNQHGRFEIAAKVNAPGKYVRLSSVMVW